MSVDGGWASWSEWQPCSVTCGGGGSENRNRTCTNPSPQYGGANCNGDAEGVQECGDVPCPGKCVAKQTIECMERPCASGHRTLFLYYNCVCGVVWCGVVWCGVVWCGVVWCGVVWCGVCVCVCCVHDEKAICEYFMIKIKTICDSS